MKGILLLIVLAVLTVGFTGCGTTIIIPTTGTVHIILTGSYTYNIYMDSYLQYSYVQAGSGKIYNVPIGNHYFEAVNIYGAYWGYDSFTQYIHSGSNYVYLYP